MAEDDGLVALDATDGARLWRLPLTDGVAAAAPSADGSTLYVIDATGLLHAYDLPAPAGSGAPALRWQLALTVDEQVAVTPLADGGALVSSWGIVFEEKDGAWELLGRRQMTAVSADGEIIWERTQPAPLYWQQAADRWLLAGSELVMTVPGADARDLVHRPRGAGPVDGDRR